MRECKKGVSGDKHDEPKDQVSAAQAVDPALPAKTDETTPAS
jgi:hypothetical protein